MMQWIIPLCTWVPWSFPHTSLSDILKLIMAADLHLSQPLSVSLPWTLLLCMVDDESWLRLLCRNINVFIILLQFCKTHDLEYSLLLLGPQARTFRIFFIYSGEGSLFCSILSIFHHLGVPARGYGATPLARVCLASISLPSTPNVWYLFHSPWTACLLRFGCTEMSGLQQIK